MTQRSLTTHSKLICVGAIAAAHGVRGHVKVKSFTQDPANFAGFKVLYTQDAKDTYHVVGAQPAAKGILLVQFEEVKDRTQAEALKSQKLYVLRNQLPDVEEDEFYHADLIGLEVKNLSLETIGVLKAIFNFGAQDVLEVSLSGSETRVLIPFIKVAVPVVNLTEGYLQVDPDLILDQTLADSKKPHEGEGDND